MPNVYEPLVLEIEPPYIGSAVSPTVDITETADDITVTITDSRGEHSYSVPNTESAIADAEAATAAATSAASVATSAASAAGTATTEANSAASAAVSAASDASDAADLAEEKAGVAVQAASDANSAAEVASAKATLANTKASLADEKATLANEKATLADQKATLANTKASLADEKATLANAKAILADEAATNANAKADLANTAAQAATDAAALITDKPDAVLGATVESDTPQTVTDAWPTTPRSAELYGKSVQDGTPTPDAPVEVQVVEGRNLLDPQTSEEASASKTTAGLTCEYEGNGIFHLYGTATNTSATVLRVFGSSDSSIIINEQGTYTLSVTVNGTSLSSDLCVQLLHANGSDSITTNNGIKTITVDYINAIRFFLAAGLNGQTVETRIRFQIEKGTTATPYVPYGCIGLQVGSTITPIDLQGNALASLPDGTRDELDISGAGVAEIVERTEKTTLTGADSEDWVLFQDTNRFYFELIMPVRFCDGVRGNANNIKCSICPVGNPDNSQLARAWVYDMGNQTRVRIGGEAFRSTYGIQTVSDLKTYLAANHAEFVYAVAEPVTHSLGTIALPEMSQPCEIAMYASLDPTWAIEYERDPNVVIGRIEASIAPVEGATASTNYSVGGYFVHTGKLYKATSAIATGETIQPGTNCIQTTVMAELVALTA